MYWLFIQPPFSCYTAKRKFARRITRVARSDESCAQSQRQYHMYWLFIQPPFSCYTAKRKFARRITRVNADASTLRFVDGMKTEGLISNSDARYARTGCRSPRRPTPRPSGHRSLTLATAPRLRGRWQLKSRCHRTSPRYGGAAQL